MRAGRAAWRSGTPGASHRTRLPAQLPRNASCRHHPTPAGKTAEGVAAYERALALHPRHAEALYNLGVAYTEQGQVDRALFMCAPWRAVVGGGACTDEGP